MNLLKSVAGNGASSFFKPVSPSGEDTIELNLQDLDQFFNSMDPSQFHEKDLDHDAEEFIVSWAREYPLEEPVRLIVHLQNSDEGKDVHGILERAVHNYFRYKADLTR